MKESDYRSLVEVTKQSSLEQFRDIAMKWESGVSYNTLMSITSQQVTSHVRMTHHSHQKRGKEYYQRYKKGEEIMKIAEDVSLSYVLLARQILHHYFNEQGGNTDTHLDAYKTQIAAAIKNPAILDDERLRDEVQGCVDSDMFYSPAAAKIRRVIGQEYEYILIEKLRCLGIPFSAEHELRAEGFSKTPDVILQTPIAVKGKVVCWIDSKAAFGDRRGHEANMDQFRGYITRYGPGLVIYWFDFLDDLYEDDNLVLVNDFPSEVAILTPSSIYDSTTGANGALSIDPSFP